MPNYVEVQHRYKDRDGDTNVDTWWAVKPTPYEWNSGTESTLHLGPEPWKITPGESIHIYGSECLAGFRKLLDRIEQEIEKENN